MAHRVHAYVRFAMNAFAPVNQWLPLEVLGIVPSFLVRDRDRIIATHVCRRWRNTFLSTPSLWSRISAFESPEKTKTYLERSKDTPLDISVNFHTLWIRGAATSFRMLSSLSGRCRTAKFLGASMTSNVDVFILKNSCPRLLELHLEIPYWTEFHGIEDFDKFPSLRSLTVIGDINHLRFPQPFNLRKLGVGCDGRKFLLSSLLELLAKIPLLEELEIITPDVAPTISEMDARTSGPVVLKHLQRLVFRGVRSEFPRTLNSLITYPNDITIILTHYIPCEALELPQPNPRYMMFPFGMQLPTPSPPKFIRYRDVQDEDSSEARCCIDLISVDGKHTLIENRYGWPDVFSLREAKHFTSGEPHTQCLGFLRTLDLSFTERFCVEQCNPDPRLIREVMEEMTNLGSLVVVNGYPYGVFMGLEVRKPPTVICPLMRRLVVRQDVAEYMEWHMLLPIAEDRAAHGSPLEQVILTSSFNELLKGPEEFMGLFGKTIKITYDLGRNTFGWEWWKV